MREHERAERAQYGDPEQLRLLDMALAVRKASGHTLRYCTHRMPAPQFFAIWRATQRDQRERIKVINEHGPAAALAFLGG